MPKRQKWIMLLFAAVMVCAMQISVFAAVPIPDLNERGSITVTVRDTQTGKEVSGGSLTLYQVAVAAEDDGNFFFRYVPEMGDIDLGLERIETDPAGLAQELAAYCGGKLEGTTKPVPENGTVTFEDLQLGLYLIVQETAPKDHVVLKPFLVTVPMRDGEDYRYHVDASPKTGAEPRPTEPSTPPTPPSDTLPQTGQLWWPVPVLAFLGVVCIAMGWVTRKYEAE